MKKLAQGAIGTGSGTLAYTVPLNYRCEVRDIVIANTTAASLDCSLYFVPSGSSPATSNMFFPTVAIPSYTTVHWSGCQALNQSDFIQAVGSGSGLTMNISGEELR